MADGPTAESLKKSLGGAKMRYRLCSPVADHDIGAACDDRLDELRNIGAIILIVAVGIDDDIGVGTEGKVDAVPETACQTHIATVAQYMVHAAVPRDVARPVSRAVVDDKIFDNIYARNMARQVGNRRGKRIGFVVARYLDEDRKRTR